MSFLSLGVRLMILGGVLLPMAGKLLGPSEAETQVTHGRTVKSSGDLAVATAAFQAVVDTPDADQKWQAVAYYELARMTWEREEYSKAIPEITTVLAMSELPAEERIQSLMIRAISAEKIGNFEIIEQDSNAILATPDVTKDFQARALMYRAMVYAIQEDFEAAVADTTKALPLATADNDLAANILYNRGVYFGQLERSAEEIADYTAAIERGTSDADIRGSAYHNRGYLRSLENRFDEAIADTRAELELSGESLEMRERANVQLSALYSSKGLQAAENEQYADAIANQTLGMETANNITAMSQLQHNRAVHYTALGQTTDALRDYDELLKRGSTDIDLLAWSYSNRADLHAESGRTDDAIADLEAALKLNGIPDSTASSCLTTICGIHETNERFDLAVTRASQMCDLTEVSPHQKAAGLYLRGYYQIQLGRSKKAASDLAKARVVAVAADLKDLVQAIDELAPEVSFGPADSQAR